MRIKKYLLNLILIFSLSLPSLNVFANSSTGSDEKAKALKQVINHFDKICVNSKGQILENTVVVDEDSSATESRVVNCGTEAIRIADLIKNLKKEIEPVVFTNQNPASSCVEHQSGSEPFNHQNDLANSMKVSKVLESQECKKSDFATEMVAGILKDVWSNLAGLWSLAKMAVKGTIKSWNWLKKVEDKTSDAALIASAQTDSAFEIF